MSELFRRLAYSMNNRYSSIEFKANQCSLKWLRIQHTKSHNLLAVPETISKALKYHASDALSCQCLNRIFMKCCVECFARVKKKIQFCVTLNATSSNFCTLLEKFRQFYKIQIDLPSDQGFFNCMKNNCGSSNALLRTLRRMGTDQNGLQLFEHSIQLLSDMSESFVFLWECGKFPSVFKHWFLSLDGI